MRILIVHNCYQVSGGEDTVVANEMNLLKEHGHEVILYSRHNNELKNMGELQKLLLPLTTIFNPRTYREIKKIIHEKGIEIVHVHNTLNLVSASVYYAALKCNIPIVQTIHNFRFLCPGATFYHDGIICEDCLNKGLGCSVKYKCYRNSRIQTFAIALTIYIHRITGVYKKINYICLTQFTKQKLLSNKYFERSPIFVKPNFTQDALAKMAVQAKEDYYIFVGRLEEIKGINLLIDAFKEMPEKKLVIIGTGILEQNIKAEIRNQKIENVLMMGLVQHDQVKGFIQKAKALVMCSQWYETFGMVIVEAYSCGTPVIVGNIGNIRGLVVEGETGYLFDYNSKEDLKESVQKMEWSDYIEMGNKAYRTYRELYAEEVNYKQLISIYEKIVSH